MHLLDLAEAEIAGKPLWNYGMHPKPMVKRAQNAEKASIIRGSEALVEYDSENHEYFAIDTSRKKGGGDMFLEKDLIDFVGGLQEKVAKCVPRVFMRLKSTSGGVDEIPGC